VCHINIFNFVPDDLLNAEHNSHNLEIYCILRKHSQGKNLSNEITISDGSWDSLVLVQWPGNWAEDRGMMVWFPPEANFIFYKPPRPDCGQRGFLFDWTVPGFKVTEFLRLRKLNTDHQDQEPDDPIISTLLLLCARVPYIYFNTQYKPEAFERFLTAIRNNGVFNFQSGYINIFLICCVNGVAPSIMFIWYMYILNYTYFIVRTLDFESRLLPPGNISGCFDTKSTLILPLLGAFA